MRCAFHALRHGLVKLVRLYNERIGIYQATSDIVIPDMATAEAKAEYIIRKRMELIR